jgi:hypothetical protein
MDATMTERSGVWAEALALADVDWCQGRGCRSGSHAQHVAGFVTARQVHRAFPPDESNREELHQALGLVGLVSERQAHPDASPREQKVAAFDFATERMRSAKLSVPRAVTSQRPDPEQPRRTATLAAPTTDELITVAAITGEPEPEGEVHDVSVEAEVHEGEDDDA